MTETKEKEKEPTIVVFTDFDLGKGSGYLTIMGNVLTNLAKDFKIRVMGADYKGQEHHFPFQVTPIGREVFFEHAQGMMYNMVTMGENITHVIVAMDLPAQESLVMRFAQFNIPYIGIFPLESIPLSDKWAGIMKKMHKVLIMSKFGTEAAVAKGVQAQYFQAPVNTDFWQPVEKAERAKLRSVMGIGEDDFVILTVADNHERKNLSASIRAVESFRGAHPDVPLFYLLVTRLRSPQGWIIEDLLSAHHIEDITLPFDKSLQIQKLYHLFCMSDVHLLSSKAEGVCLPVLESMAMNLPVVAPNHTSFAEHVSHGGGVLVDNIYVDEGVWGNEYRYFVDIEKLAYALETVYTGIHLGGHVPAWSNARAYALTRTAQEASDALRIALS